MFSPKGVGSCPPEEYIKYVSMLEENDNIEEVEGEVSNTHKA